MYTGISTLHIMRNAWGCWIELFAAWTRELPLGIHTANVGMHVVMMDLRLNTVKHVKFFRLENISAIMLPPGMVSFSV